MSLSLPGSLTSADVGAFARQLCAGAAAAPRAERPALLGDAVGPRGQYVPCWPAPSVHHGLTHLTYLDISDVRLPVEDVVAARFIGERHSGKQVCTLPGIHERHV